VALFNLAKKIRKKTYKEGLFINPAIKYLPIVITAKAGIQEYTGCRIKSGMMEAVCLIAGLIQSHQNSLKKKKVSGKRRIDMELRDEEKIEFPI